MVKGVKNARGEGIAERAAAVQEATAAETWPPEARIRALCYAQRELLPYTVRELLRTVYS